MTSWTARAIITALINGGNSARKYLSSTRGAIRQDRGGRIRIKVVFTTERSDGTSSLFWYISVWTMHIYLAVESIIVLISVIYNLKWIHEIHVWCQELFNSQTKNHYTDFCFPSETKHISQVMPIALWSICPARTVFFIKDHSTCLQKWVRSVYHMQW